MMKVVVQDLTEAIKNVEMLNMVHSDRRSSIRTMGCATKFRQRNRQILNDELYMKIFQ
jgi:hypothetical protein